MPRKPVSHPTASCRKSRNFARRSPIRRLLSTRRSAPTVSSSNMQRFSIRRMPASGVPASRSKLRCAPGSIFNRCWNTEEHSFGPASRSTLRLTAVPRERIRTESAAGVCRSLARPEQLRLERRAPFQRTDAHRKFAEFAIEKIVAQRARDGAKRNLAPRDVRFVEEPHFEALRSGLEVEVEQARAEHDVDLVDVGQADHRVQQSDVDPRMCLFGGLALGPGKNRLAVLQKTRRQRPQSPPRLDRALAQKHLVVPYRQATDDDFRILIMDRATGAADVTRQRVAVGNPEVGGGRAAVAAEFHGRMKLSR